jgi:transcriptional regulator with XRE-family HTH domain
VKGIEMSNVVTLAKRSTIMTASFAQKVYNLRNEYGLTLTQAAEALSISTGNLENIEQGRKNVVEFTLSDIENLYEDYLSISGLYTDKNLLFNTYPLRVARDILELTIEEFAELNGYKLESWKKIESHRRKLPKEKIREIEKSVRVHFRNKSRCVT